MQGESSVPCNGCTACCKRDLIRLRPEMGDDLSQYAHHMHDGYGLVLDHKPNGECIYLTARGCGIHGRAPFNCRAFDCRTLFRSTPKEQRRIRITENPTMRQVYDAARSRLKD